MDINRDLLPPFVDLLLDAVFLVGLDGRVVYVSAACERMFGYTPQELTGQRLIDHVAPQDRARTLEEAGKVVAGCARIGFENHYVHKDGHLVAIMWSASWSDTAQLRIGVARDISERKHAEQMQAATYAISEATHDATDLDQLFQEIHRIITTLVPLIGFAVVTCDIRTGQLAFACRAGPHAYSGAAWEADALRHCAAVIRTGEAMAVPDDEPGAPPWLAMPLVAQKETIGVLLVKQPAGTARTGKDSELLHFVAAQAAMAIRRRNLNDELLRLARYDQLTGLANRRLFEDRLEAVLARCRRKQCRAAVLFIDLDGFKQVNDTLGHAVGDLLLQHVAQQLKRSVREVDTVARLGGDEFVILLEEVDQEQQAMVVADTVRRALLRPAHVNGQLLQARASIGLAFYPDHGLEAGHILRHADQAMYLEKKTGRSVSD
ncbi:sensor domain-containing diguanylate cyclase [Noviherbaspirillum soli]|uniref:sensor domain-containing diguanylate cyclase n=1 Tax=Noviherbaspirillum soli TaxID=1064518 RepID=UPI00188ADDCF|nr:sensor domain-containing diguanylate cyclase [Noviherbaspirillum soli]